MKDKIISFLYPRELKTPKEFILSGVPLLLFGFVIFVISLYYAISNKTDFIAKSFMILLIGLGILFMSGILKTTLFRVW